MPNDDTLPKLRFIDAGDAEAALATLVKQGVRPQEILACEVFYDPERLNSDQARESVRALDVTGALPISTIAAAVSLLGGAPTRIQAIALPTDTVATYDKGGQWGSGESVLATRLVTASGRGDIVEQSHAILGTISEMLTSRGLDLDDVVKFNIYYRGDGTQADWAVAARVRAGYFTEPGPATTGIPVPGFEDPQVEIAMQVLAIRGAREQRQHSWPDGHWDWPFHLPYKHGNRAGKLAFIGGQVPLDGEARTLDIGDFPAQVRRSLAYIDRVLDELAVPRSAVQRLTAYVAMSASDAAQKLSALEFETSQFFGASSPALVPVPLPVLAYPDMDVEIEVQALVG